MRGGGEHEGGGARPVLMLACSLPMTLAGCGISGRGVVRPDLPVMPANLSAPCRDPGVTAGRPVLSEFARSRQALAECKRKQRDTVAFYSDLRERLR